jgi:hypothetical protein
MFRLISAIVDAYVGSFVFYLYAALTALSFTGFVAYAWALAGLMAATRLDLKSVLRLEVKSLRWDFINVALVSVLTLPFFPFGTLFALLILIGRYRRWPYVAAYYALLAAIPNPALVPLPAIALMRLPLLPQFTLRRYIITLNGAIYLTAMLLVMLWLLPHGPRFEISLTGHSISDIPAGWPLWGLWLFIGIHLALYLSAAALPYRALSLYYYIRTGPMGRMDKVFFDVAILYALSASVAVVAALAASTRADVDLLLPILLALWASASFSIPQKSDEWATTAFALYFLFGQLLPWIAESYGLWTSAAVGVATAFTFRLYWTKILEVGHALAKAIKAVR